MSMRSFALLLLLAPAVALADPPLPAPSPEVSTPPALVDPWPKHGAARFYTSQTLLYASALNSFVGAGFYAASSLSKDRNNLGCAGSNSYACNHLQATALSPLTTFIFTGLMQATGAFLHSRNDDGMRLAAKIILVLTVVPVLISAVQVLALTPR